MLNLFSRPVLSRLVALPALCLTAGLVSKQPALAHEFWIEPEKYQVETGDTLRAGLRNGEMFKGARLPYLDARIRRFETSLGDRVTPYEGRMGDMPAMVLEAEQPGLLVVLHETTPDLITYDSWEKFAAFAQAQGLFDAQEQHQARGLPSSGFGEYYTRHSKLLVAVGDGAGSDRAFDLEIEFVALQNPYDLLLPEDGSAANLQAQLLYQGQARPLAQVELFERSTEDSKEARVQRHLFTTDVQGMVHIPVRSGRRYLLNSVVLRPYTAPIGQTPEAVWESLWASMVFAIP